MNSLSASTEVGAAAQLFMVVWAQLALVENTCLNIRGKVDCN